MKRDDLFAGYEQGQADMLAKCTERWSPLSYLQGQRDVFAYHPEWTVTDMCKPDCLPCQRLTELITEREKGYEEGQRDAIAAAVQRVVALAEPTQWRPEPRKTARISDVIAAIKGDSDD